MRLHSFKAKPEASASKDQTRPVLTHLYLRITGEGDARIGRLEATDSYKLVSIPVEVEDGDTEGFIPVEVLKAARKASRGSSAVQIEANGGLVIEDGTTYPRPEPGTWPKTDQLIPTDTTEFEVGLSARFLWDLAQAFGDDRVVVKFTAAKDGSPDPLRPIHVRPMGSAEGVAILMPVRVGG